MVDTAYILVYPSSGNSRLDGVGEEDIVREGSIGCESSDKAEEDVFLGLSESIESCLNATGVWNDEDRLFGDD